MFSKNEDYPLVLLYLWLIVWCLGLTYFGNFYPIELAGWVIRILNLAYIFDLLRKQELHRNNIFKHIGFILFSLLVLYYLYKLKLTRYIDTVMFFYTLKDVDYKKILKCFFVCQIGVLIMTIGSSLVGIIPNITEFNAGRYRSNLGFDYVTFGANILFFAIAHYIGSRDESHPIRFLIIAALFLFNVLIYKYTKTRAAFYESSLMLFGAFFVNFKSDSIFVYRIKKFASIIAVPALALISIVLSYMYDPSNSILMRLDSLISGRLFLSNKALVQYGVNLWGNDIVFSAGNNSEYFYLDSSYINILIRLGGVCLILLCFAYSRMGFISVLKNNNYLTWVLLFVALHNFTEPHLIELQYNGFLLLFFNKYYNDTNSRNVSISEKDKLA